jgi:hypothetical protein
MQESAPETRLRFVEKALSAFEAAMSEATEAELWRLHIALEKTQGLYIVRGRWGSRAAQTDLPGAERRIQATACPLSALFADRGRDADQQVEQLVNDLLAPHGFVASDFYAAWDRRWIGARDLLRAVDSHITQRIVTGSVGGSSNAPKP